MRGRRSREQFGNTYARNAREAAKLDELIEAGKGKQELARLVRGPFTKQRIVSAVDENGQLQTSRDSVLEFFARCYETLYAAVPADFQAPTGQGTSDNITVEEVEQAVAKMKRGKSYDDDGLCAEMLKTGHKDLLKLVAEIFTDILHGLSDVPAAWKCSRLIILYKKGQATLPKSYRPVAIISVLCKLFSMVLLKRIGPTLHALLDPEQAGFRPDHSCSDVIMFMRMVSEKAEEWGEEIWAASLDLEKAFDKVYHESVLDALLDASVDPDVVNFLAQMCRQQSAYVCWDDGTRSRLLKILRGVRQGDPMSPALFNNVTRIIFRNLKEKWNREGLGTPVCKDHDVNTTHVMFADDTTLFAASRPDLIRMVTDVKEALAHHGLNLNVDKCVAQTNCKEASVEPIVINGQLLPMVSAYEGFKVLGTQFTLLGRCSAEIRARISGACVG